MMIQPTGMVSNDRKIFPKDLIASVYVQKNESIQELVCTPQSFFQKCVQANSTV